jgi:protein-tyrosine phosphatase
MADRKHNISILFVSMGNICRSPTAEAVFRHLAPTLDVDVDSAGTHGYHLGEPADKRARGVARRRGMEIPVRRARQLIAADFEHFDWIIVMDERNRRDVLAMAPVQFHAKVHLLLEFAPDLRWREVPDPYGGSRPTEFDRAMNMIEAGIRGLIKSLRRL